jgi:methyl-CpG-binding domain protein 4
MSNCTSRKQVDKIREEFFNRYPDPESARSADPIEMEDLIKGLGFRKKRTDTIQRFSNDWVTRKWSEPKELYGIGKYAQDSWEIFQKGNLNVEPTDGVLIKYLNWAKSQINI